MTSESADFVLDDGKEPQALRTIGEVSAALGIRQHVLRYWEEQFPMLRPVKRRGGRRHYRPDDVALIAEIDRLVHREGFTLKGAKKALKESAGGGVAASRVAPATPAELTAEPVAISSQLRAIRDGMAPKADPEVIQRLRRVRTLLAEALQAA